MMRRIKIPMTLYALHGDHLQQVGSTTVEIVEWTHADGTRTYLAPFRLGGRS